MLTPCWSNNDSQSTLCCGRARPLKGFELHSSNQEGSGITSSGCMQAAIFHGACQTALTAANSTLHYGRAKPLRGFKLLPADHAGFRIASDGLCRQESLKGLAKPCWSNNHRQICVAICVGRARPLRPFKLHPAILWQVQHHSQWLFAC